MLLFARNKVPVFSASCAKALYLYIKSMVLNQGYFVPLGTFAHVWRYSFHCHKLLGGWGGVELTSSR